MTEAIKSSDYFADHIKYYWHGFAYTGSFKGMRFRIHRDPMIDLYKKENEQFQYDPNARIVAHVYPDERCFEKTDPRFISSVRYPFTDEGLEMVRAWVNLNYEDYADKT